MRQATITINGRIYDALTGKPVQQNQSAQPAAPAPKLQRIVSDIAKAQPTRVHPQQHPAHSVHSQPQRSTTLNRQAAPRPQAINSHRDVQHIARSPLINRHQPAVIAPTVHHETPQPDALQNTTALHPSVMAAMQSRAAAAQQQAPQSSKELKEALIREQLAQVSNNQQPAKPGLFARWPKLASILVSSLSLLILGGYFTYVNLTNISMRVAASNAGINASFPGYKPDGYSLNGPITYAPGEVAISYKSNTSDSDFTLTQKTSSWDSQGVLDNFVRKQTSTYLTFQQRGVTVYTFSNKAAWTNGGLLYTIEGDASLSSDQILRLATSL